MGGGLRPGEKRRRRARDDADDGERRARAEEGEREGARDEAEDDGDESWTTWADSATDWLTLRAGGSELGRELGARARCELAESRSRKLRGAPMKRHPPERHHHRRRRVGKPERRRRDARKRHRRRHQHGDEALGEHGERVHLGQVALEADVLERHERDEGDAEQDRQDDDAADDGAHAGRVEHPHDGEDQVDHGTGAEGEEPHHRRERHQDVRRGGLVELGQGREGRRPVCDIKDSVGQVQAGGDGDGGEDTREYDGEDRLGRAESRRRGGGPHLLADASVCARTRAVVRDRQKLVGGYIRVPCKRG